MSEPPPVPIPAPAPPPPAAGADDVVIVEDLSRRFGDVTAVDGISFRIPRGHVVGFIGANGAGKTTTMRILATLEHAGTGRAHVCGFNIITHPAEVRARVGWMPDSYGTYDNMTVWEYLDFFARAYAYRRTERQQRIAEVMDFADLTPLADRYIDRLSKGMGQRLCFGRTLLHDPEFLILDEPAAGLDPKARIEFKNLVRLLAQRGKTIFISSHILSDLGEMCDSLLFIDQGRLVHHGSAASLLRGSDTAALLNVTVEGDPAALVQWAAVQPGWELIETRRDGARLRVTDTGTGTLADGLRRMILDGIRVVEFHREERRLEDAFVDLLRQKRP
jgi:ABC-2 type transport system ATP-binding protein